MPKPDSFFILALHATLCYDDLSSCRCPPYVVASAEAAANYIIKVANQVFFEQRQVQFFRGFEVIKFTNFRII